MDLVDMCRDMETVFSAVRRVNYSVLGTGHGDMLAIACACGHAFELPQETVLSGFGEDAFACPGCSALHIALDKYDFSPLGLKFVRKYMRRARHIAEENDACHARQIGCVLIDPVRNKPLGDGYNGPPSKTPHCDSRRYLDEMVWPQLTESEKTNALRSFNLPCQSDKTAFLDAAAGCQVCPRRLAGAPSGTRLELCSCEHAERNAIYNAGCDLMGAWMFCWCPTPCWDCGKAIVQARIKRVFCITDPTYGDSYQLNRTRFLFQHAGVELFMAPPGFYLEDQ
jgi:deoxycytidylate deaminase